MNLATGILIVLAGLLFLIAWRRDDGAHRRGLYLAWDTLRRTGPLLILAFFTIGLVEVLAPQELVSRWMGPGAGLRGILIGELAGVLLPGGPYVVFPLIASLYQIGAGLGAVLAMIVSWSGLALISVTFELPFMGWRFTLLRLSLMAIFPLLIGLLGTWLE